MPTPIRTGSGSYNLACIYSLRGDETACLDALVRCREAGEPLSRAQLDSDADFDPVRNTAWFQEFMAGLP